jgi:uncharacterized cupredoxin-like copper-binding protein
MVRRRIFVLATLAAGLVAIAALAPSAFGTTSSASNARYTVTMTDFKFRIAPVRVRPGKHRFLVINRGQATHDFKIGTKKTRLLNPGQRQTIIVTLKKGRYTVICTVPGHASLGMRQRILVR